MIKELKIKHLYSILLTGLIIGTLASNLTSNSVLVDPSLMIDNITSSSNVQRLISNVSVNKNHLIPAIQTKNDFLSVKLNENEEKTAINKAKYPKDDLIPPVSFKINSIYDLVIDKDNGIYPSAMEKNATKMRFLLNFTIDQVVGFPTHDNVFENLTISNETFNQRIDPDWGSSDWVWTNLQYMGDYIDNYSLSFSINSTIIDLLDLGHYNLTLNTYYYMDESWHQSYDYIELPMKDLRVSLENVFPTKFNNKLDTSQLFNITIQVTETMDGSTIYYVQTLPEIFDVNNRNINPNVTLVSNSEDESGILHVERFVDTSQQTEGRYMFEVNLSSSLAPLFEDGLHKLVVSVTSNDGIIAINDSYTSFEAKGTALLVELKEITKGGNDPLDWGTLTSNGNNHVDFRINIRDTITVSYQVYEENGTNEESPQLIGYQDPNQADNPFAINTTYSTSYGNGTITLNASVLTPASGYSLLFFVRGHRTSQESSTLSNVTIYWDSLIYDYSYYDSAGDTGSSVVPNQKALGLDVNSVWTCTLNVYYASDNTPARSAQISYRFSDQPWQNLTDGANGDPLDGTFIIDRNNSAAAVLLFESRIANGSVINPQGTLFVNSTLIASNFNLTISWTYLTVVMTSAESDLRLGVLSQTEIYVTAIWAHNVTLPFNGFLIGEDWYGTQMDIELINGFGTWGPLIQVDVGKYHYEIVSTNDPLFGITTILNNTDGKQIAIDIIWEEIYFTFSNAYNSSLPVAVQDFEPHIEFFANYGQNATLYCYGIHLYDDIPFKGVANLTDWDRLDNYILDFDTDGIAIWEGDFSDANLPVDFSIWEITNSTEDYGVDSIFSSGEDTTARISWDKIIVTLEADMYYSHGDWADIVVSFDYLIYNEKDVNISTVRYNLNTSTNFYSNISWIYFQDFSLQPTIHWYNVTFLYDSSTGLTGFETRFIWTDFGIQEGNLAICWIDDQDPTILEVNIHDFGNGSIILIVDVTDNSENWLGSGIANVELIDKRPLIDQLFPVSPQKYTISSGVYRYVFKYTYNQPISNDFYTFDFEDDLKFIISITDRGTTDFPSWLGNLRNSRTTTTQELSLVADFDIVEPQFVTEIEIDYLTLNSTNIVNDGEIVVTASIQDLTWSGLDNKSVRIVITDIFGVVIINTTMESSSLLDDQNKRSELQFIWKGTLNVFNKYYISVTAIDNSGNVNNRTLEVEIEDRVAPRIINVHTSKTSDRRLRISVEVEETGSDIDYIMVQIGNSNEWFNLTRVSGGIGSGVTTVTQVQHFSAIIPLNFDVSNLISEKIYSVRLRVADRTGNEWETEPNLYSFKLSPIVFEPFVLLVGAFLLIIGIIMGIRITSRTEGYDMNKILAESLKVTRKTMLIQMDEYALGVTVNFFDQVQGPVPVIWEPPLLEDQEQVMLDLADKSFSTLEFVELGEEDRSGTFDFSTGSYECTALGYSFAVDNPEARGGKENLTIVLLLRKEWGENLLTFQDELLEKIQQIRDMILNKDTKEQVEKKSRQLREFVSRLLISFNKLYTGIDYETFSMEE